MSQKVSVKGFKWVKKKKLSEFTEEFIKKYLMKIVIQDIFLK